jgi:lycopene beta-cyclase
MSRRDYIIVGGGLQGGLLALVLRHIQPDARVTVLERAAKPAGNHTWSFHAGDLPADAEAFVRPLLAAEWQGYQVAFPNYARRVPTRYAAIRSERFAEVLEKSGCELRVGTEVVSLSKNHVRLADGTELAARCVIDARGPEAADPPHRAGYQKFVGLEIETERPWPDALPTVMDATVSQDDGYRFVYTLPFTPHRVLVEDTYFADGPALDTAAVRERVGHYIESRNVGRWVVVREEAGVLPMPWAGGRIAVDPAGPLVAGYAGGWLHPATGYSFPVAVRLALAVARTSPEGAHAAAAALARRLAPRQRFARFLNRLLFTAVVPEQRWQVFRRLYRSLPDALMSRFYALEFGPFDAVRMVAGWPPPLALSRLIHRPEARPCPSPVR